MKKSATFILVMLFIVTIVKADYFEKLPYTITQPNGTIINCFVSGDEFYNWIHDNDGYTIIQAPNGYFYYAETFEEVVRPTEYLVNSVNPGSVGLTKWAKISKTQYNQRRDEMFAYRTTKSSDPSYAPHSGAMNNLVVYIRFSDDAEFTTTRQVYDDKLNPATGSSLKSYFKEVSYNNLTINSTHYPACALSSSLSFMDSHPRAYFQPYNATTNPIGYNSSQRTTREHQLLVDAINWININSPVSTSLDLDLDFNSNVDNVTFIIKGNSGGWSELLWAHRWSLYSQNVLINGKRVYDYTFQPENQVSVKTLCHEMFHCLGAPDLYHYTNQGIISPVGAWDLMESGGGHMLSYMKWKYSNQTWISSIPEITTSGTYTLNPLTSATNNCFKIASPNSTDEFFMVEYRNKTGTFESTIPGSGLIVYRIDTRVNGNSNGPPDEIYLYRPGGTTTVNGTTTTAFFSSTVGRTAINNTTNPACFLQNGSDGGLNISNVTTAGATISFTVTMAGVVTPPSVQASAFTSSSITETTMTIGFTRGNGSKVLVVARQGSTANSLAINGTTYTANTAFGNGTQIGTGNYVVYNGTGNSVNVSGLTAGTAYSFAIYEYTASPDVYLTPALTGNVTTTLAQNLTAGISGGSSPICNNTAGGILTATGNGGNGTYTYLWYKNGASLGVTTQIYTIGNLIATSAFYCAVSSGSSGTVNTATTTITVYPSFLAGISGGTTPICSNTTAGTITATGTGGSGTYTYLWYKNGASTGITTQNYATGNLTTTSSFYCAITSGSCGTVISATTTITVTAAPTATISYTGSPYCISLNTPQSAILNGTGAYTGGIYSSPSGLTINSSTGAFTPNAGTTGLHTIIYTIPVIGGCTSVPASTTVTISPATIAGSIAATDNQIIGGEIAELTLTGNTGTITKWKKSTDGGSSWTDIASTVNPYSEISNALGTSNYLAVVKSGVCPEASTASASIDVGISTTTFIAVNGNWETAGNWSNGVPTITDNVTIPANNSIIINAHAVCNNITIAPLGRLTINTAINLSVTGTLTIQSNSTGSGSLIDNGTLTTSANYVECFIPHNNADEFHMLSSPVTSQAISPLFNELNGFYTWSEQTGNWIEYGDNANFSNVNGGNNFIPGKAYSVSYPNAVTKRFEGILNRGTINIPLTVTAGINSGWNFTANPYPSAINWDATSGWTRNILANADIYGQKAMWVWNASNGNYGTYISNTGFGTNGVTNNIAISQGFWVIATTAGTFSMNDNVRVHSSQAYLKSTTSDPEMIRLSVTGTINTFSDEIIINFGNANDLGGAEKMFSMNATAPGLYSTKLNKNWSINNLTTTTDHSIVPIDFKAGVNDTYTLHASNISSFANTIVYLKDLSTNNMIDLNQNASYTFTANTNDNLNRFQLIFSLAPLGISDETIQNTAIYAYDYSIYVNSNESIQQISVYNTLGQLIKNIENSNGNIKINMEGNTSGYYIVKVVTAKNIYSEKVMIK